MNAQEVGTLYKRADGLKEIVTVEVQILFGEKMPTYFVDRVLIEKDGRRSHNNLRAVKNKQLARMIAREAADQLQCTVFDESIYEENKLRMDPQ
jgi:hypothetical protein